MVRTWIALVLVSLAASGCESGRSEPQDVAPPRAASQQPPQPAESSHTTDIGSDVTHRVLGAAAIGCKVTASRATMVVTCAGTSRTGAPKRARASLPDGPEHRARDGVIVVTFAYQRGTRTRVDLTFEDASYLLVVEWPEVAAHSQVLGVVDGAPGVSGEVSRELATAVWRSVEHMDVLVRDVPDMGCHGAAKAGDSLGRFLQRERRWMRPKSGYDEDLTCFPRPWLSELECEAKLRVNHRDGAREESEDVAIEVVARFTLAGVWKKGAPVECYLAG